MMRLMLKKFTVAVLAALLLPIAATAEDMIKVVAGRQVAVEVGKPVDILVGNSAIAKFDYRSGTSGVVIGRSPGITSLTLTYAGGREETRTIQVIGRDPHEVLERMQETFNGISTLKYRIAGDIPVIEGTVSDPADARYFEKLMHRFPDAMNMVRVTCRTAMLGVAVRVMEVNLTKAHQYNPTGGDHAGLTGSYTVQNDGLKGSAVLSVGTNVLAKMEYWLSNGTAMLIADPVLTAIDGEKARLQIGGQIPYEYQGADGLSVEWKDYGVILSVVPVKLASGELLLDLDGEVSSVDESRVTAGGVPGIIARKFASRVAVGQDETLVISGIKFREKSNYKKRVPILGHLLPFLFYQRSTRMDEKELVITVTPAEPARLDVRNYRRIDNMKAY